MTEKERQTVAKAKTDEERQFKPFGVVVQEARAGVLHRELSEQFANLVAACREHGKKGSLTLVFSVAPNKDGATIHLTDDIRVKAPKGESLPTLFFADEDGNVTRRDPRQPEIEGLREVAGSPVEPRHVEDALAR